MSWWSRQEAERGVGFGGGAGGGVVVGGLTCPEKCLREAGLTAWTSPGYPGDRSGRRDSDRWGPPWQQTISTADPLQNAGGRHQHSERGTKIHEKRPREGGSQKGNNRRTKIKDISQPSKIQSCVEAKGDWIRNGCAWTYAVPEGTKTNNNMHT